MLFCAVHASTSQPSSSAGSFPANDVLKLTQHGFSQQQAIEALSKSAGNVDQALVSLLAKSFQVP